MGPGTFALLSNPKTTVGRLEGDLLTLYLKDDFARKAVDKPDLLDKIGGIVSERRGSTVRVRVTVGEPSTGVPVAQPEEKADPLAELVAFGRQAGMTVD